MKLMIGKLNIIYLDLKSNNFFKDSFWALLGNVIAKGMSLLGAILVARFLGKDIYGEYSTIRTTLTNLAIFSTFGLGYTATKYIAEYKKESPEFLKTIMVYTMRISFYVSSFIAIILLLFANFIASEILEAGHLTIPLRFFSVWIVFNSLTAAQIGVLSGFNAFKTMARISIYIGVFAFLSSVCFTYFWQLEGALFALLITQILNWYLYYKEVHNYIPKNSIKKHDSAFLRQILKFSIPVALQEGLYSLTSWLKILLLLKLNDYGEVGLYSAAMQWSAVLLFVPGILRNVILTHLSGKSKSKDQHQKVLKQTLLINFIATFIPFIIIYFLKAKVSSFYGTSFGAELESVLVFSLITVVFISLSNVYTQGYLSLNKNWIMFSLKSIKDLFIIGSSYFLITSNFFSGAKALVLSSFIAQFVFLFLVSFIYHKFLIKKAQLI